LADTEDVSRKGAKARRRQENVVNVLQAIIATLVGIFCIATGVINVVRLQSFSAIVVSLIFLFLGATCLKVAKSLLGSNSP
jgi:hypothetical protein